MTTPHITLEAYERAERDIAHEGARIGLTIHGVVTVLVSALLIVLNFTVAEGFPWSAFAVAGMCIGLGMHWWFGFHRLDEQLTHQQQRTEQRAAHL